MSGSAEWARPGKTRGVLCVSAASCRKKKFLTISALHNAEALRFKTKGSARVWGVNSGQGGFVSFVTGCAELRRGGA